MDWAPTDPSSGSLLAKGKQKVDDSIWLRPQRFFAPENPTGLEGLFERTKLVDDVVMTDETRRLSPNSYLPSIRWKWLWICAFTVIPMLGFLGYRGWTAYNMKTRSIYVYDIPSYLDLSLNTDQLNDY